MARRTFRANWLALCGALSLGSPAAAQYAYPPPGSNLYPPPPASNSGPGGAAPPHRLWTPEGVPGAPPSVGGVSGSWDQQRRQAEQLWYGGQGAAGPAPAQEFEEYRGPAPAYSPSASPVYRGPPPPTYQPSAPATYPPTAPPAYPAGPPAYGYSPGLPPPMHVPAPGSSYQPPSATYQPPTPRTAALPTQPAPSVESAPATPEPSASAPAAELFEAAQVVAVVGDEHILAGDLMPQVNQWIEANREKIPPGREAYYRKRLMEQVLEGEIQTKLIYLDFLRQVRSKGAGEEKISEIHNRIYEQFDEKRLPDLMEKAGVTSPVELDAKMREQGSSLLKHKRQFAQKVMSQQWLQESERVDYDPVITHAQMLDAYKGNAKDYEIPAKAKWEHLMVRFDKAPDKAAAYEMIRAMGNEVYLGGAPLWAVAKRGSHGVTASSGGLFESTTQGSLKSKVLDQAIFSIELNKLSPILEDEEGFHIVRVLERQEASRTSFEKAQAEIKEKLKKEQINKQINAYLADLREKTYVRTIFDEEKKQREQAAAARKSESRVGTR